MEAENGPRNSSDEEDPSSDGGGTSDAPGPAIPLLKVCPKCRVQSQTDGNFCPHCGAPYVKSTRLKLSKRSVLVAGLVLLLSGAGTATVLGVQQANAVKAEQMAAEAKQKADEEADAARKKAADEAAAAKAAQDARDETQREYRALVVRELEKSVQKDATERVTEGILTGPIKRTECTPLGGGSTDDLTSLTGTFECIAVNETKKDGSESGYVFSATIDWSKGSYTWHLGR